MVTLAAAGLVVAGAILLLAGAAISIYGVALLGLVLGGGAGYLVAPQVGLEAATATAGAVVVGAVIGLLVTYLLLSAAVGTMALIVGSYVGMAAVSAALDPGPGLVLVGGLAVGMAAALLGTIFKRTTMVFITAFLGAALASRSITPATLETARDDFTLDPLLFDLANPLFVALVVLGLLSQFGLFKLGYVGTLVSKLPGASVLRDRERSAE